MFYYFPALISSLIFGIALELIILSWRFSLIYALLALFFSALRQGRVISGKTSRALLLFVLVFFDFLLLYFIDSEIQKHLLVIFSTFFYYLGMVGFYRLKNYNQDQTAQAMLAAFIFYNLFIAFCFFYGFYLNFNVPLWIMLIVFGGLAYFVNFQYFSFLSSEKNKIRLYSALIAFASIQLLWILSFWPFGYLTTATVALASFYIFWSLTRDYFLQNLSKKRLLTNLIIFSLLLILVLSTSRWQIIF